MYVDSQMPNCCMEIWSESSAIIFPTPILNLLLPPEWAFWWAQSASSVKKITINVSYVNETEKL